MSAEKEQPLKDEASKRRDWRGEDDQDSTPGKADDGGEAKPSGVAPGQFSPPD